MCYFYTFEWVCSNEGFGGHVFKKDHSISQRHLKLTLQHDTWFISNLKKEYYLAWGVYYVFKTKTKCCNMIGWIDCIELQKNNYLRWSSKYLYNLYVNDFWCMRDFNTPSSTDISRWRGSVVSAVVKDISQLLLKPFWTVKKSFKLSEESVFHIRQTDSCYF